MSGLPTWTPEVGGGVGCVYAIAGSAPPGASGDASLPGAAVSRAVWVQVVACTQQRQRAANEVRWHCGKLFAIAGQTRQKEKPTPLQTAWFACCNAQTTRRWRQMRAKVAPNRYSPTAATFTIPKATTSRAV